MNNLLNNRKHLYGKCAIYAIRHINSEKVYIGSSKNLYMRWMQHKLLLRKSRHHSWRLQRDWNEYGEASFEFVILQEISDLSKILDIEQEYLNKIESWKDEKGYNILSDTKLPPASRKQSTAARSNTKIRLGEIYRDLLKLDAFQCRNNETQQADKLLREKLIEGEKQVTRHNKYLAWKRGITPAQLWMDVLNGNAKPPTAEELSELRSQGLIDESGDVPGLGV